MKKLAWNSTFKTYDHGNQCHHSMTNRRGKIASSDRFNFVDSQITADGDCSHEIKRRLLLGRKVMTNRESVLKSRDITLPTKESEVVQSCPTLCNPMGCSLPGSSIHGIFQAKVLEWVAISFSRKIFPTQGLNPGLPHCRQMLYRLSYQGSQKWDLNQMP